MSVIVMDKSQENASDLIYPYLVEMECSTFVQGLRQRRNISWSTRYRFPCCLCHRKFKLLKHAVQCATVTRFRCVYLPLQYRSYD